MAETPDYDKDGFLLKIQKMELLLFLEFRRICNKYNIRYSPIGGSLIGVVRHQGFIPWDDDIDVGMLREDFDRFNQIAKSELGSDFFLQTNETDPNYTHPITRICLNGTRFVHKWDLNSGAHPGFYLDIFPYDGSPENKVKMKLHKYRLMVLKIIYADRRKHIVMKTLKSRICLPILRLMFSPFKDKAVESMLFSEMQRYNNQDVRYVVRTGSQYPYEKVRVLKSLMDKSTVMSFEDFDISVMIGYHTHLRENYGDYMSLPPENKRRYICDTISELDFGKYDDMNYILERLNAYKE